MVAISISRKRFLGSLAGGTVVLLFQGCGGGGGDGGNDTPPSSTTCSGTTITNNHGHTLTIPVTDLDSTTDKVYSIMGGASHDHTARLTPAMLGLLKASTPVTATSSPPTSSTIPTHTHDVTVSCV